MLKNISFLHYRKYQRIIIAAICVALASQVQLNAFTPGFIIALSALLLPIFLYFNQDIHPLQLGCAIAIASPVFRGVVLLLTKSSAHVVTYTVADIVYFLLYTLIYYLLYWRLVYHNDIAFFLTIIICDYAANVLEIGLLTDFAGYTIHVLAVVFAVALVRATLASLIAFLLHYFQLLIVNSEEHERQYYHFIWVASAVKSEVYFMRKTINDIERVTKNAYLLNERLKDEGHTEEQKMAYEIAQHVHEIKNSYQDVIKGLGDYFNDQNNVPMHMDDILKIVSSYTQMIIRSRHLSINLVVHNTVNCTVPEHYYLVTIMSNLILNGIDAIGNKRNGEILIQVSQNRADIQLAVTDNGSGIPREMIPLIFKPGFSTKFDQSGDIYRGIGLSNVQTIVQEQFAGQIKVDSQPHVGTTFFVTMNKDKLTSSQEEK
ncbi:sensor histidine kinase [Limosilactobacillus frumenti]|uniref:sensor histidine kinase n=1 Tax=Limosilactobacillus frumenti TaxID=104955 RepID=UPI00070D2BEF|nr:ATP-binding protein [Limosilactobacillus frumenti]MBA2913567.1 ATP-binding protein [Limosilactobacillus frumenti]QFG73224.1 ATP-binding protein [Limosilactobacillus frumenti]